MREALRSYVGDVRLIANTDKNLAEIKKHILQKPYSHEINLIIENLRIHCDVISNYGSSHGLVVGASSNYFDQMKTHVEWIGGSSEITKNEAIIEKNYAQKLGVETGDNVTIEYITSKGAVNTSNYRITGVFIGNKYEHYNKLYVLLKNAQELAMKDNFIDRITIFLNNPDNDVIIQKIVDDMKSFSKDINLIVWRWNPQGHIFFKIFQYSRIFIKIIISIVIFVLLIILFFSIQNSFYLIFNERSNEISVLATYGMMFRQFYQLVFWETILLSVCGILSGYVISFLCAHFLAGINLSLFSDEIVVLLGGANLFFSFIPKDFFLIFFFILLVSVMSTFFSLYKFLKAEIREMQMGV